MHPTAMKNNKNFFDTYGDEIFKITPIPKLVEIGSQDVNGSLKQNCPNDFEYIGVDFVQGKGVDIILENPYQLPFESDTVDVVISSSCFEHSEMFWVLFLEIMRIMKPTGVFYLNVPSNGDFHRWPVDCWRFYPDSGRALAKWAHTNSINVALLESYTSSQEGDQWNDFVAVFLKDEQHIHKFPHRILNFKKNISNGYIHGNNNLLNFQEKPEDKLLIMKNK